MRQTVLQLNESTKFVHSGLLISAVDLGTIASVQELLKVSKKNLACEAKSLRARAKQDLGKQKTELTKRLKEKFARQEVNRVRAFESAKRRYQKDLIENIVLSLKSLCEPYGDLPALLSLPHGAVLQMLIEHLPEASDRVYVYARGENIDRLTQVLTRVGVSTVSVLASIPWDLKIDSRMSLHSLRLESRLGGVEVDLNGFLRMVVDRAAATHTDTKGMPK
jgi:hypothetical protein